MNNTEYKNIPKSSKSKDYCGWWSSTFQPEPSSNDSCCEALHLDKKGRLFYRNEDFSYRGTFYSGTWKYDKNNDILYYHLEYMNNLRVANMMDDYGTIKFINRNVQLFTSDNKEFSNIIPPIKSKQKSARK